MVRQKYTNAEHQANLVRHEVQNPQSSRTPRRQQFGGRRRLWLDQGPAICGSIMLVVIVLGVVSSLWGKIPGEAALFLIGVGLLATIAVMRVFRNLW